MILRKLVSLKLCKILIAFNSLITYMSFSYWFHMLRTIAQSRLSHRLITVRFAVKLLHFQSVHIHRSLISTSATNSLSAIFLRLCTSRRFMRLSKSRGRTSYIRLQFEAAIKLLRIVPYVFVILPPCSLDACCSLVANPSHFITRRQSCHTSRYLWLTLHLSVISKRLICSNNFATICHNCF